MRNVSDTSADPQLRRSADRRIIAIVLAGVSAACLVVASLSKSWMANPNFSGLVRDRDGNATAAEGRYLRFRGDIRFGPLGFEHCAKPYRGFEMDEAPAAPECREISTTEFNEEIGEAAHLDRDRYTSGAFSHAGWIAFGTCLLSAAALLAAAAMAFLRIKKDLAVSPASMALLGLLGAMVSGCVFIATKPGPAGMLGVDLGFWAFGAGTVLGILGAQLLAKEIRPPDEDLLEGAIDPAEFGGGFGGFPLGRDAAAPAVAPAAVAPIPPTQPVDALDLVPGLAPGLVPGLAPSPAPLPAPGGEPAAAAASASDALAVAAAATASGAPTSDALAVAAVASAASSDTPADADADASTDSPGEPKQPA